MLKKKVTPYQSNKKTTIIILLSILGLIVCSAILFPQIRLKILSIVEQILRRKIVEYQAWLNVFLSYSIGGICFILFFDYCTLTHSGRLFVHQVKQEIKDCLNEIDVRSLLKPVLLMSGVYLLGILTILRANYLYMDDIVRSIDGFRNWYNWSRYISEFASIFIHADINLTDISPFPQLLAVLFLAVSSVILVYVMGNRKITVVRLLASIPLGLSPYFLECLSFKFDAPYMALSILASMIPFMFVARKKAFLFCSVVCLWIMCMTYQAVSGIYLIIVIILCFQDWNSRKKTDKEILSFGGIAALAYCFAMLFFSLILMKHSIHDTSATMHPLSEMIPGIWMKIQNYTMVINQDFGLTWKIGIVLVGVLFVTKSLFVSAQKKISAFFVSMTVIVISFILSYGVYIVLSIAEYPPRTLLGFGVFLAILCVYVVSDFKKIAVVTVLALNWCFMVFAFSYGNALADQERYAEFRIGLLLHDLSALFPNQSAEDMSIQLESTIDYAPSILNISKHYPVIERVVHRRLGDDFIWDIVYIRMHFNYIQYDIIDGIQNDFKPLDLPVVLDSYYHTIKSDGNRILITLKH